MATGSDPFHGARELATGGGGTGFAVVGGEVSEVVFVTAACVPGLRFSYSTTPTAAAAITTIASSGSHQRRGDLFRPSAPR
ncbi:MAG TPA: hypothetical protein VME20_13340 [Acidimicrobiales bacterium]|nr:hypothetical protein [Acidimicrobiales bacterium]